MRNSVLYHSTDQAVRRQQLSTVVALRIFALCSQAALVLSVHFWLKVSLPLPIFSGVLLGLLLLNTLTWLRLRRHKTIGPYTVALQLLVDVLAFSVLLYYTGGVTNPFVSLYLPLLGLAAALLPWGQVVVLAGVCVAAYGLLMTYYQPLHLHMQGHEDMINLHLWGMGVNFLVSVLILVGFVARLSGSLRKREHDLALAQSRLVEEERLAALGNQAASIAHQLSTPVSTIAVMVADWQDEPHTSFQSEDFQVLSSQVQAIQSTLQQLRNQIEGMYGQRVAHHVEHGRQWLEHFLSDWRNRNPEQEVTLIEPSPTALSTMDLAVEPSALGLALNVLLDNASQSQARAGVCCALELSIQQSSGCWVWRIADRGAGIAPEVLPKLGREAIVQGKSDDGHGLGVFLIANLLDRQGVQLRFENNKHHGATATLTIPSLGATS